MAGNLRSPGETGGGERYPFDNPHFIGAQSCTLQETPDRGNLDAAARPEDSRGHGNSEAPMSEESAQARARRWRWITLAELLAVVTVGISAFALYDAHSARSKEQSER